MSNKGITVVRDDLESKRQTMINHAYNLEAIAAEMLATDSIKAIELKAMATGIRIGAQMIHGSLDLARYWNGDTGGM